jgi:hypothetical protein
MSNTGGPAFPTATLAQKTEGGMTLRDYFAAKAMPAILEQNDVHVGRALTNAAWIAYQMADAMLKAREA